MSTKVFSLYNVPEEQFRKDIKAHIKRKLRYPTLPKKHEGSGEMLKMEVNVEVDSKFYKTLNENTRLQQMIHDDLRAPYQKCCEAIAAVYEEANAKIEAHVDNHPERAVNEAWEHGKKKIKEAVDEMAEITKKHFKEQAKAEHEYAVYQAKIVCTLTLGAVSIAANVALLAATPFTAGASTIIGIIGMGKTTGVVYTEIKNALKEPLEALKEAHELYEKLQKNEGKKYKGWKGIKISEEVANGIFQAVIGIKPLKSLSKLQDNMELAEKKILGVNHNLNAMAKKIGKYSEWMYKFEIKDPEFMRAGRFSFELNAQMKEIDSKKISEKLDKLLKDHEKLTAEYQAMSYYAKLLREFVDVMVEQNKDVERIGKVMEALGTLYDLGTAATSGVGFDSSLGAIVGVAFSIGPAIADLGAQELADIYEKKGDWRKYDDIRPL